MSSTERSTVMSPTPPSVRTPLPRVARVSQSLWHRARAASFWAAVCLPAAYLLVPLSTELGTESRSLLLGLLGVHLLALFLGRGHGRSTGGT